ncbi:hypothetical protein BK120_11505 [Paenibacillus sp. FSL A5-0031]|uniref:helix-turn-helix domain-containing protein n=1 Tax=Paenibacillus sp. FSL A5-0031 TaxID=1920420 RepID=UPI00096C53CE|nr:AraC family transcriptional regulator [Paenibacillus sp. FSL A5-0031]OME85149.1 hypothetical protein BK120_11505 [Paenibacillus sp. FSL A5-0031]
MDTAITNKSIINFSNLDVTIKSVELYTGASGEILKQHVTRWGTLIISLAGSGTMRREDGYTTLERDHIYACPPDSTFGLTSDLGGNLSVVVIRLKLADRNEERVDFQLDESALQILFSNIDGLSLGPAGYLSSQGRTIYDGFASDDGIKKWRAKLDCSELLYMLITSGKMASKEGTKEALERARAFMKENCNKEMTIELLANMAELSPKYFVDLFKKTYGVSALDYLTRARIDLAKSLMLRTDRLLKEVAHEVGYADEFYFSRKFKQLVGMSPTAYLKKRGKRIAVYGSTALIGYLLPLDIIPYAAPLHPKWSKYYCDRYGLEIPVHLDAYRQNHFKEANIERLETTSPDFILCDHELEPWERARLSEVAPIFALPDDRMGWRKKFDVLAEALGAQSEAKKWLEEFERKKGEMAEKIRLIHQSRLLDVAVLKVLRNTVYMYSDLVIDDVIYQGLGISPLHKEEGPIWNVPMSFNNLKQLNADYVLLLVCQESETLQYWTQLQQSTDWMSLPFVRENRVKMIPSEPWREYSPVALSRIVDETALLLTGNRP